MAKFPRALLRKAGFDVVRYSKALRGADARRLRLISDLRIDVLLDVGASEGNYGRKVRETGYLGRMISFEPLTASYQKLAAACRDDRRWEAIHGAIGDVDGSAVINVSGRNTSSSLLRMQPSHVNAAPDSAYVTQEEVSVNRLDTVLAPLVSPTDRLYLKIDVQGYEANVLAGATRTLESTHALEVELSMVSLYEGSVLYDDMIRRLSALGFSLVSWEDVFTDPETGFILQADCIFSRRA